MRCLIVDDEMQNRFIIRNLVEEHCSGFFIVAEAENAGEAFEQIKTQKPDIVFLDIEMPDSNGFDLLNRLGTVDFEIIFVTAFHHYAVQAFKYSALDYLLKPVDVDELKKALEKARLRIKEKNIQSRIDNFLQYQHQPPAQKRMALPSADGLVFIVISDIVACSAEGPYTHFYFIDNKNLLVSGTLKEFEDMLPAELFCRVHHSHLVNTDYIKKYYKGKGGYLEMVNGKTIEVSQRKREEFLIRFRHKE